MVLFVDKTKGLTLSELLPNRTSICQYLQHEDLYHLKRYITKTCYKTGGDHAIYDPLIMLKLVIVKFFRQLSHRDTIQTLTDQDCRYLGLPWIADGYTIPARSTLHHFVKSRLKEEGVERLMEIIGTLICKAFQ